MRSPKEFNSSKIQIHLTDIANWNLKEREFIESFYSRRFFCLLRCISSLKLYFTNTNRTTPKITAHLPSFEWSYFTVFAQTQSQEHINPVFRIIVSTSLRSKIKHSMQRFITIWNGPKFAKKKTSVTPRIVNIFLGVWYATSSRIPLVTRGVLPLMAYTGKLRPKGVPFSCFRYMNRLRVVLIFPQG